VENDGVFTSPGDGAGARGPHKGIRCMKTFRFFALGAATLGLLAWLGAAAFAGKADDDKPKFTIKQVMKKAHGEGLLKAVLAGDASKDDKQQLLELYTALSKNTPPKGEARDWKEATTPIVEAAKAVADGKDGAIDKLKAVAGPPDSCKSCHSKFKPAK
jgi:hypothetical protein